MNKLNFVSPEAQSSAFFAAMSVGYKEEVSAYGTLMEVISIKFEFYTRIGRETMEAVFSTICMIEAAQ